MFSPISRHKNKQKRYIQTLHHYIYIYHHHHRHHQIVCDRKVWIWSLQVFLAEQTMLFLLNKQSCWNLQNEFLQFRPHHSLAYIRRQWNFLGKLLPRYNAALTPGKGLCLMTVRTKENTK